MSLVFSILLGLLVLVGLIATFMTIKHWHWAQMLLMLGVFLASVGVLFLSAEVVRIHKLLRTNLPKLEAQVAALEEKNEALETGSRVPAAVNAALNDLRDPERVADAVSRLDGKEALAEQLKRLAGNEREMARITAEFDKVSESGMLPSLVVWDQQNQVLARQRGRVWRLARKASDPDAAGTVQVAIGEPRPHGIEQGAIVYVFEMGEPNAADPAQGSQYIGEFRVAAVAPDGVTLSPVLPLDRRTLQRLAASQRPWSIYETMPADRHDLFGSYNRSGEWVSNFTEEQLRRMLPAASVEEYIRQGGPVTRDDDEYHRQAFNEENLPIGPESSDPVASVKYNRPLRAYGLVFSELADQRAEIIAGLAAEFEDFKKLQTTQTQADQLNAARLEEKQKLTADKEHMDRDLAVITALHKDVADRLAVMTESLRDGLRANAELAAELTKRQLAMLGLATP